MSILLEVVGLACIVGAAWWIFPPMGLALLGAALVAIAQVIGRGVTFKKGPGDAP